MGSTLKILNFFLRQKFQGASLHNLQTIVASSLKLILTKKTLILLWTSIKYLDQSNQLFKQPNKKALQVKFQ